MTIVVVSILGFLALLYVMWLAFLMIMALDAARAAGTLTLLTYRLSLPAWAVATCINILINTVVLTAIFGELPREKYICQRLARHAKQNGLQGRFARMVMKLFIQPFDIDEQIKRSSKKVIDKSMPQ